MIISEGRHAISRKEILAAVEHQGRELAPTCNTETDMVLVGDSAALPSAGCFQDMPEQAGQRQNAQKIIFQSPAASGSSASSASRASGPKPKQQPGGRQKQRNQRPHSCGKRGCPSTAAAAKSGGREKTYRSCIDVNASSRARSRGKQRQLTRPSNG